MEFAERGEIGLLIDDGDHLHQQDSVCSLAAAAAAASVCLCRICHEEEEERSTTMESPCACSGTLKFAHRECIQRWCNEKGSVVCEICLQKFESGYTIAQKKTLGDVEVTIRGSLEVPRINYDPHNPEFVSDSDTDSESDYAECSPASSFRVSYFRSVALIFIVILLVRNLVAVMTAGEDHYAFTILTVLLLRASGILLPLYLVMRFIAAFQEAEQDHLQQQQQQLHIEEIFSTQRETLDEHYEHRIQIRL